jgi:transcriptional regulator with XRE-family HTH domain
MKMKQPELGRKIAELRKAKGLTQEELVDRCQLSVRTLQRIESGEVLPRPHTLRVILAALDYDEDERDRRKAAVFLGKAGRMFNLKLNTMTKISALTAIAAITALIWLGLSSESQAQSVEQVRHLIEEKGEHFVRWFNEGKVDSMMTQIHDDACLLSVGCGKEKIRQHYSIMVSQFRFDTFRVNSVSVADSIAVEKGEWTVTLSGGLTFRGAYMTEWRLTGDDWLIINDISETFQ